MTRFENIGALIPVRLASERLPGKALKQICNRPVIYHLLDRVCACKHLEPANVVICTTNERSDDTLVEAVEAYGAGVFRGATDDIIDRFHAAMKAFDFDAVVQVDGDDPLSATEYMDRTMDHLIAEPNTDIITVRNLPLGTATKSFTRTAMEKVIAAYQTQQNDTGFIYFFTKTGLCTHAEIDPVGVKHIHESARLTLDYEDDLTFLRSIFDVLYEPDTVFGLADVVKFLNSNPALVEINRHVEAEYNQRTIDKAVLEYRSETGEKRRVLV